MTLPHPTQRTLPASCSSSVTRSDNRRLCVQVWGGLVERGWETGSDCSRSTVSLWDGKQ